MAKYNDEDIIWRTIGGRRIPIRTGQSLSQAMKESGKFNTKSKKTEEEKQKMFNDTMNKRESIIEKLDEETKDLSEYDKYNLAVSKLENTEGMSATERQYWVGTKNRYEDSMSYDAYDKGVRESEKFMKEVLSRNNKKDSNYRLSEKQKEAGEKLNKNAENGIREDFNQVLSGKQTYDGEPKELARELSNEWGVDLKRTEEILNEETKKHLNKKEMTFKEASENQLKRLNEYEDAYDAYDKAMTRANEKKLSNDDIEKFEKETMNKNSESQSKFGEQKEWQKNNKQYFRGDEGKPVSERTGEPYKETSYKNIRERDAKDLLKQLNDEGSDFTFGDAIIKDGKIETDVGVFMPDERGYVTKDLSIPIDSNETYASLENKLRDWQSRHNSPDSFYDKDFESSNPANMSNKDYDKFKESMKKSLSNIGAKDIKFSDEKQSTNYRDSITEIAKNSAKDNVTLNIDTGEEMNFKSGYSVSFQQSSDNYSDEEYNAKIKECREKCDGNVYVGKYGGDAEPSFHTEDLETAKEIMYKYNQESIYDAKHDTLIMNDKYDASKNQTNYKAETTNDVMNKSIRNKVNKKRGKVKEDLPKKVKIESQGTSNRKEVSENIQAHILSYYDKPEDFVQQMDAMSYLPTNWHRGEELAKGGSYMIYYDDQRKFLDELKINPKGKKFSDDRVAQTYNSLIGRESAKLYDRLKKNAYKKYLAEHPGSEMSFSEFKEMTKED